MSLYYTMNKVDQPRDDQGVMDLGKNCAQCNTLDFLPFHCEFCDKTFCSQHRGLESHHCVGRPQKSPSPSSYSGPTAASLFPDKQQRQQKLEASLKAPSPTNIVGSSTTQTPFQKLAKFLHVQRTKRLNDSKKSIFGKSKPSKTPSPTAEVAAIKKTAKGPNSVAAADRIYVWVVYINRNDENYEAIDPTASSHRVGTWVSKNWSVGRSLDAIADAMSIFNHNNTTQQSAERLNLFKVENDTPVALETSKKVAVSFATGSTLYLVKGV